MSDDSDSEMEPSQQLPILEAVATYDNTYYPEVGDERAHKRLKTSHEPDDDNPFALASTPSPPTTLPRYTRPVEYSTLSHADLSSSLKNMFNCYEYSSKPPSTLEVVSSFGDHTLPSKIYQVPYYSDESDAPDHPREYAGLVYHLRGGEGLNTLDDWVTTSNEDSTDIIPCYEKASGPESNIWGWQYAGSPPDVKQVRQWLRENAKSAPPDKPRDASQVSSRTKTVRDNP